MEPEFEELIRAIYHLLQSLVGAGPVAKNHDEMVINRDIKRYERECMTHSQMNAARCFMVEFSSDKTAGDGDPYKTAWDTMIAKSDVADLPRQISRSPVFGALYTSLQTTVRAWLEKANAEITDSGQGVGELDGWHIGVHCTPGEAWRLFKDAQEIYAAPIKAKVLTVVIKPWSVRELDRAHFYRGTK